MSGKPTTHGPAPSQGELLRVGRVARAHGLKGELEVRLDWSDSQALVDAPCVLLVLADGSSERRAITAARHTHKGMLLRLEGIDDRGSAEARKGASVNVARADLPPLADGEYYLCDLVGLQVSGPEGDVGRVIDVQVYPSVDAIVIEAPGGARFEQPLLAEWLARVDVAAGALVLRSLGGLLEQPAKAAAAVAPPAGAGES